MRNKDWADIAPGNVYANRCPKCDAASDTWCINLQAKTLLATAYPHDERMNAAHGFELRRRERARVIVPVLTGMPAREKEPTWKELVREPGGL
jgi:hypothetical protein